MNIRKWFEGLGYLQKVVCLYCVCAAVPMVLATFYNYFQTRGLLVKQAYSDMRRNIVAAESGLNTAFLPYKTIMRLIENDRLINTQLSIDYTNLSYSDIAYYSSHTLNDFFVLYPQLSWLRFYSSNDTLPDDRYYFFRLESLDEKARALADDWKEPAPVAEPAEKEGENEIMLISRMNYFSSDAVKNYLALGILRSMVQEQLYQEEDSHKLYLLSHSGAILASSDGVPAADQIRNMLSKWQEMPEGEIRTLHSPAGTELICLKAGLDMGMSLVMTVDRCILLKAAGILPKQTMAVFLMVSVLAFLFAVAYSRFQTDQLQKIIGMTKKLEKVILRAGWKALEKTSSGRLRMR